VEKLKNHIKKIVKEMMNELSDNSAGVQDFLTYIQNDSNALKHIMSAFPRFKNIEDIKEYIKEIGYDDWQELEAELEDYKSLNEEGSTTAGVGGYLTPKAFAKKGQKMNAATATAKKQGMKTTSGMPKNSKMLDYKELWPGKKSAMNEEENKENTLTYRGNEYKVGDVIRYSGAGYKIIDINKAQVTDNSEPRLISVKLKSINTGREIMRNASQLGSVQEAAAIKGKGRRFIPKEFEFPSFLLEPISLRNEEPKKYFKIVSKGDEYILLVDPLVVTSFNEIERGRTSFEKEQKLAALTRYIKERIPQQVRGLMKKYSKGVRSSTTGGFVPLPLVLTKIGDSYFIQNPSVGSDNIKSDIGTPLYEAINKALVNEVSYNKFKKDVSYRSKTEMLHRGIKEVKKKLQEINRIVEYTSRMKQELSEGEGVQYWTRTEAQLQQVAEMVNNLNEKINKLK